MPDDRPQTITTSELTAGLRDLAGPVGSDYQDDILRRVARTPQRPAWTFIERWTPMTISMRLAVVPRALAFLVLLLGLILAMTLAFYTVGSQPSRLAAVTLLPPVGPAGNGLIAFDSAGDIWLAEADGSDPRPLTSGPTLEFLPVWSPDGTRLAYWTVEERGSPASLVHVRPDGSDPVTVATSPSGEIPWRTDWSPEGSGLAFALCVDTTDPDCGDLRIHVAAADGSGAVLVGDPDLHAAQPDWSPDGASIAFQGAPPVGAAGVYIMAADGSDVRRLSQILSGDDFDAFVVDWSPDGRSIVTQAGSPLGIWSAPVDDEGATRLADGGIPWWSPDGAWVAYLKGMSQLALVSADGTQATDLAIFSPGGFVWSPDAAKLVVYTTIAGGRGLAIIDATTGDRLAEIPAPDQSYPDQVHYPSWQRVAAP